MYSRKTPLGGESSHNFQDSRQSGQEWGPWFLATRFSASELQLLIHEQIVLGKGRAAS